jgi:hypothetical protein
MQPGSGLGGFAYFLGNRLLFRYQRSRRDLEKDTRFRVGFVLRVSDFAAAQIHCGAGFSLHHPYK